MLTVQEESTSKIPGRLMTWSEANWYCNKNGWRLPNSHQIKEIAGNDDNYYWTSKENFPYTPGNTKKRIVAITTNSKALVICVDK